MIIEFKGAIKKLLKLLTSTNLTKIIILKMETELSKPDVLSLSETWKTWLSYFGLTNILGIRNCVKRYTGTILYKSQVSNVIKIKIWYSYAFH